MSDMLGTSVENFVHRHSGTHFQFNNFNLNWCHNTGRCGDGQFSNKKKIEYI